MLPVNVATKPSLAIVSETEELIIFLAKVANTVKAVLNGSGVVSLIWKGPGLIKSLIKAVSGITHIPAELEVINEKEKARLIEIIKKHLEYPEEAEKVIVIAMNFAFTLKSLIGVFK